MNASELKELLENATPGPWVFSAVGRASVRAGDVSSGKKVAVTTGLNDNPSAENHYMCCANARLIALAPQLAAEVIKLQAEVEILQEAKTNWNLRANDLEAEVIRLRDALEWYGEQTRLCRLLHSGGDTGRNALAEDGGKRAHAALNHKETDNGTS